MAGSSTSCIAWTSLLQVYRKKNREAQGIHIQEAQVMDQTKGSSISSPSLPQWLTQWSPVEAHRLGTKATAISWWSGGKYLWSILGEFHSSGEPLFFDYWRTSVFDYWNLHHILIFMTLFPGAWKTLALKAIIQTQSSLQTPQTQSTWQRDYMPSPIHWSTRAIRMLFPGPFPREQVWCSG